MTLRVVLLLLLAAALRGVTALVAPKLGAHRRVARYRTAREALVASSVKAGVHGQGFHFMPMSRPGRNEHYPRILPIAGVLPGITIDELMAAPSMASAPKGTWAYDFSGVTGVQLGKVAIPGSEIVTDAVDPVVLITTNTAVNIQCKTDVEMLLVIDRQDPDPFDSDNFYLFRTQQGDLKVMWSEQLPGDMEIVGKVVTAVLPFVKANADQKTGWAEEDEEED